MCNAVHRIVAATCSSVLLIGLIGVSAAGEADKELVHRFKVTIESTLDMEVGDKESHHSVETHLAYTWTRKGKERILSFDSQLQKFKGGGGQVLEFYMSQTEYSDMEGDKPRKLPIEKAPERMRKMAKELYGVPICKIEVDENGKEVKRTSLTGKGAKGMVNNDMLANATMFHVPYFRDKDEWETDAEFNTGNGGYTKGKLKFKKNPGGNGGQKVEVMGTLTDGGFKFPGRKLKNVKHIVRGEQTFDPDQGEWTSGTLNLYLAAKVTKDDQVIGTAKGSMVVTLDRLAK